MNDATFLRRMAARGRVALLADGTAVPAPQSVMDNEDRAGSPFIIDLVSPTDVESGDGRSFKDGTITIRDLPIPLLWQFALDDGHKGAVIVGRIDFIEETDQGLGNARGVFDSGPWGQEAERLVRGKFLRGVSGDYSNFSARVTPAERESASEDDPLGRAEDGSVALKDDKVHVTESRLVSVTLVSKPAFEGCYIRLTDLVDPETDTDEDIDPDSLEYEDGEIEAAVPITADALIAGGMQDMVQRLERLEAIEAEIMQEEWALLASAARQRVSEHKLRRDRDEAVARMAALRNVTAGGPVWFSAPSDPMDKNGATLRHGSVVRWPKSDGGYHKGHVHGFHKEHRLVAVRHRDTQEIKYYPGARLEAVKAVIPAVIDGDGDDNAADTDLDGTA